MWHSSATSEGGMTVEANPELDFFYRLRICVLSQKSKKSEMLFSLIKRMVFIQNKSHGF